MEIRIPVPAEEIINKLNEHGYEAYVVGGCVRDMLLGREPGGLGYHHQRPAGAGKGGVPAYCGYRHTARHSDRDDGEGGV